MSVSGKFMMFSKYHYIKPGIWAKAMISTSVPPSGNISHVLGCNVIFANCEGMYCCNCLKFNGVLNVVACDMSDDGTIHISSS